MTNAKEFQDRLEAKRLECYNELMQIGTKYGEYKDVEAMRKSEREKHAERWKSWASDRRKEWNAHLFELESKRLALIYPNLRDAKTDVKIFGAIEANNGLHVQVALTEKTLEEFRSAIEAGRSPEYLFSFAQRLDSLSPTTPDEVHLQGEMKRAIASYREKIGLAVIDTERREWIQVETPLRKFEAEAKLAIFNPSTLNDLSSVLREAKIA